MARTEQHRPRAGEFYRVTKTTDSANKDVYAINGENNGTLVRGTLTVYVDGGDFNGYDWQGSSLTEDQLQAVLDLFEASYPRS